MQRSTVVYGPGGSGKHTALNHLYQRWQHEYLFVTWTPSGPDTTWAGDNLDIPLFLSIRTAVAHRMLEIVADHPSLLAGLTTLCREFLRWLFEVTLPERQRLVKRRLIAGLDQLFTEQEAKQLYSDFGTDSVRSQLDEMVILAGELGFLKIVLFYVAPAAMTQNHLHMVEQLLGWLDLWQRPDHNFLLKAALPASVLEAARFQQVAHDRIEFRRLRWTQSACLQIVEAWLARESGQEALSLSAVADASLLTAAESCLHDISGEYLPIDCKILAQSLVDLYTLRGRRLSARDDTAGLRRRLYHRLAPLEIDEEGVLRGVRRLKVRDTPLLVLSTLARSARTDSNDTRKALLEITGSENNLHKQISELRKAVEPLPPGSRDWVYICNGPDGNYRLDGISTSQPVRNQSV